MYLVKVQTFVYKYLYVFESLKNTIKWIVRIKFSMKIKFINLLYIQLLPHFNTRIENIKYLIVFG